MVIGRNNQQSIVEQLIFARDDWRKELATNYDDQARRLLTAYQTTQTNLEREVLQLAAAMGRGETLTDTQLANLQEWNSLLARVQVEMDDFSRVLSSTMSSLSDDAIRLGSDAARSMAVASAGDAGRLVLGGWVQPDPEMLRRFIGYIDSPAMTAKLNAFGDNAAKNLSDVILAFTGQGKGSDSIASALQAWFNVPYSWAENMARTSQAWSYRGAAHANYAANSNIVTGWMWYAALDERVCPSCIAQHGTIHGLDDMLNDHHRGRCTPLPIVKGSTWQNRVQSGPAWFDGIEAEQKRLILGRGGLALYNEGRWDWSRASVTYTDDIYGTMRRASTLQEMMEGAG